MRLLTAVDQLFLLLESRKQPMHVGGLFIFELPEDAQSADCNFVYQLVQQMQTSKVPPSFPFNQVLEHLLFWKKDEDFIVEHHFRHVALPKPARVRELLMYISKEHSRLLDRAMPLWECHVIEGICPETENGPERFALYFKIHHSLVDGIAAMRLIQKSLSQSPTEPMTLPVWSLMARHRNQVDALIPAGRSAIRIIKEQLSTIKPVFTELIDNIKHRGDEDYVGTFDAPMSVLNQRISASRRIAAQSYEMQRFRNVADVLEVNMNDVLLAVCSGAMRRYLLTMNALPTKPLIAFVPMSLRSDNSASGNQISFLLANLGTHLEDPIRRLQLIHCSMNSGKRRFRRMNQAQVINYSAIAYAWEGLNVLTGLFPKKQAFNLIISNVPGVKKPLYWNGALLKALYPASIIIDGQAMNITYTTYLDKIEFCITACSKLLPHVQDMLALIEDELCLLENISEEKRLGLRE
ncbi:wax ester/triacylglycerol synthase family O-acyltransferase [Psychrobacter frigidicola]|uniref:diacylglycerol O-acyltransferase n=1 Tax=Psychrobacter frigidicola TaxID=45611 RepID=A0A5C7A397_9GAMM|nr:wax ester/triacylglycerol synthase family O-acyltransferase [Psychrobacter frigidicola]TXD96997.1 wax ester/triacylglycerol synthase family O-acyltransferase [Psychrobacter frigidicola]